MIMMKRILSLALALALGTTLLKMCIRDSCPGLERLGWWTWWTPFAPDWKCPAFTIPPVCGSGSESVSYTHLDVYKRQGLGEAGGALLHTDQVGQQIDQLFHRFRHYVDICTIGDVI